MNKRRISGPATFAVLVIVAGLITLGNWHSLGFISGLTGASILFLVMFISMTTTLIMSIAHRDILPLDPVSLILHPPVVGVAIPAYNEDPELLAQGLRSFQKQSLKPNIIFIVDDGSTIPVSQSHTIESAIDELQTLGIQVELITQINAGKRHAQVAAFAHPAASLIGPRGVDIWLTVDSDTILHKDAVRNLVIPFQNKNTMSVAGIAYGINHRHNLLTRVIELGYTMSFLNGRASEGLAGAVRVNCGVIAAYRAEVINFNLERYLGQTFLGQKCLSGDDRALTIFARERGKTLFQSTAIAYSAHPVKFSHLIRQRLRWAKSWYWGTWWLLTRPVKTAEFWMTLAQVFGMISYLIVLLAIAAFTLAGAITPLVIPAMIGFSTVIMMVSSFRYVTHGRTDVSVWDRLFTWALAPVSTVLFMFVLNPLYWVAAFQLKKMGWGTRAQVEVTAGTPAPATA